MKLEDIQFKFPNQSNFIIKDFNFSIVGSERVVIVGANGSGKTTLVKIILGRLKLTSGEILIGTEEASYLDQYANILDNDTSLLENFLRLNPKSTEREAHHSLAQFLFRNVAALKKVKQLSGGEKLRALLACILIGERPPKLLILDELTNHLDIESITRIESILLQYQGALIVISHDSTFLHNIGVKRFINAPFLG